MINKKYFHLLMALNFFFADKIIAQPNLVGNSGFENGTPKSDCNYLSDDIGDYIDGWKIAPHNNDKGEGASPIWEDLSDADCNGGSQCGFWNINEGINNGNTNVLPSNRFVFIRHYASSYDDINDTYDGGGRHNALGIGLAQALSPGESYIIRMKIIPFSRHEIDHASGRNHLRVIFARYLEHWDQAQNSITGNQQWEDINANIQIFNGQNTPCRWYEVERHFTVPLDKDKLFTLVFYVEEGGFGIDDVELFKECEVNMLIDWKLYDGYFFRNTTYTNTNQLDYLFYQGYVFTNQAFSSIVTNNSVLIAPNAHIIYKAGNEIILNPGFEVQNGGIFEAIIEPCGSGKWAGYSNVNDSIKQQQFDNTISLITDSITKTHDSINYYSAISIKNQILVFPNPNKGEFIISIKDTTTNYKIEKSNKNIIKIELYDTKNSRIFIANTIIPSYYLVNISSQSKGIYFLKISTDDEIRVEKVVME